MKNTLAEAGAVGDGASAPIAASLRVARLAVLVAASVLPAVLVGACTAPEPTATDETGPAIRTIALGEVDHALYPTLTDTILSEPFDFVIADDRIWVAETRASIVTVLDRDFRLVRRIGRHGQGPGELTDPFTVRVRDGLVSVGDRGTGRFEFFDTLGAGVGSLPLRAGHEHILLGPDRVVAVDTDSTTLGTLIEPGGAAPFGSSPSGDGGVGTFMPMSNLHRATLDGAPVITLVPQNSAALHIHDVDGEHIETRELPAEILEELREYRASIAEAFRGAVVGSSLVKEVGVSQNGRYVTFTLMSETAPVLIHDLDGRDIFYLDTSEHRLAGRVKNARTAVYDDGLLYLLSDASLFAFELDLPD